MLSTKTKWGDKTNRRLNILQAARQQLEESGYQALNIRHIATSAGVSPGLLYTYFANKEELFATLYAERLAIFQQEMVMVYAESNNINQLFLALVKKYLPVYQLFGKEFNLFSLLRQNNNFPEALANQLTQTARELMMSLFQHSQQLLVKQGALLGNISQAELVLPMFWIVLNGLADHFSGDRQYLYGHDIDTMTHFISSTLLAGLQAMSALPNHLAADEDHADE